jgi:DNA-directed RNA polymerase specialized sigma24 family protein
MEDNPISRKARTSANHSVDQGGEQRDTRVQVQRLFAGTPREVLARLVEGDPLGVRDVVGARLRARWMLFDADRVHLRALALIAREAGTWVGRPALGTWLRVRVDRALDEVLVEARRDGAGLDSSTGEGAFAVLGGPLGLTPAAARATTLAFDYLPAPERRAFLNLVIEGQCLDDVARGEGTSASEVGRRARTALDAILVAAGTKMQQPENPT